MNPFFDDCECIPTTTELGGFGVQGTHVVLAAGLLGVLVYTVLARRVSLPNQELVGRKAHAPLGIGLFYNGFTMCFTVFIGFNGDFFTAASQSFIMFGLAVYTILGAISIKAAWKWTIPQVAMYLVYAFCALAGFWTFTVSVLLLSAVGLVLFIVMSITIRCLRSSWDEQECGEPGDVEGPSAQDHLSDAAVAAVAVAQAAASAETSGASRSAVVTIGIIVVRQLTRALMGLVNFVMQVGLLSFTVGDLQGLRQEVKAHFVWTFDVSVTSDLRTLQAVGWLVSQVTEASVALGNAADTAGNFLLDYSNLWTPNMSTAFSSVGTFEVMVVVAVFTIVLSDCLLILAPRDGSGEIAKHVVELASRLFLYVVQLLVSVSHALIFALTFVQPIERPPLTDSQQFFADFAEPAAYTVTNFYVGVVMFTALYVLLMLWSGEDAGMQNIAPRLLRLNGVDVKEVEAGKSCPLAFVAAFFGFWPQRVKTALEVGQRTQTFRLGEEDVILATVNALSFPLYVVPYGAVFAKFGEYMNQCPIYVSGRDFHFADVVLSLTYAAEYALVLFTCSELLVSSEQGYPTTGEDAVARVDNDWVLVISVCWLCLTLIRAAATGIREFSSSSPNQEQQSLSLGVTSFQSNKGQLEKLGTGSIGIVSCQSSTEMHVPGQLKKAGDSSREVKEVEV
jgi:hypothetical protein